jgi:hypothetical protein
MKRKKEGKKRSKKMGKMGKEEKKKLCATSDKKNYFTQNYNNIMERGLCRRTQVLGRRQL